MIEYILEYYDYDMRQAFFWYTEAYMRSGLSMHQAVLNWRKLTEDERSAVKMMYVLSDYS
jgi:hypothetical protein